MTEPPRLILGDCLEEMAKMAEASVDAVVTDPPYGIGFMNKGWDRPEQDKWGYWAGSGKRPSQAEGIAFENFSRAWAEEAIRVLKPGGYLVAFGGTRTFHRLGCALEDAGFEVRDTLMWLTGQGFPKSLNIGCRCEKAKSTTQREMRHLRHGHLQAAFDAQAEQAEVVLEGVPESSVPLEGAEAVAEGPARGGKEPCVEGRGDVQTAEGELRGGEVCALPDGVPADGEEGRLCHGAPATGRPGAAAVPLEDGGSTSPGPSAAKQPVLESRPLSDERGAQTGRGRCSTCGGLNDWAGWGTALKPAWEPILLARKPLVGTVAENVLRHGVGGLNIDGCRITNVGKRGDPRGADGRIHRTTGNVYGVHAESDGFDITAGRWPVNVVLSHADDCQLVGEDWRCVEGCPVRVLDEQSGELHSGEPAVMRQGVNTGAAFGAESRQPGTVMSGFGDSGGASRFFYTSKASRSEREEGLEGLEPQPFAQSNAGKAAIARGDEAYEPGKGGVNKIKTVANIHPTVKPIDLMRWLVRLVAPPGALVLDPFVGSGTTLIAAWEEGCRAIGIEKDPEYHAIAQARAAAAVRQLRLF